MTTTRKLHYILLAEQIPLAKICSTIKAVLKCFLPANLDDKDLKTATMAQYKRNTTEAHLLWKNLKILYQLK